MKTKLFTTLALITLLSSCAGWKDLYDEYKDKIPTNPPGDPTPHPTPAPETSDFEGVIMLGGDVRNWAVTSKLTVSLAGTSFKTMDYTTPVSPMVIQEDAAQILAAEALTLEAQVEAYGGSIGLNYDKATVWPGRQEAGATVNANPWVIFDLNGNRYAATWEWLRYGQTAKSARAVAGDHIKRAQVPNDWHPKAGDPLGIFVSGLIRGSTRNVSERTDVVWVIWPE
jgi:hypothetical protein